MESIGVIIGILGVLGTIVAAGISYHNIRVTRKIAESSGALNVPQMTLGYGISPFDPKISNIQEVVYGMPQIKDGKYVGVFRVVVSNVGKRAAENVKLEVVIPAGANRGGEVLEHKLTKGILPGVSRETFRIDKLLHVYHYFPIINPEENISIDEPFWIEKTVDCKWSTTVTTKDKMDLNLKLGMTLGFVFRLDLHHKDGRLTSEVPIYIMEAKDINAIAKRWIEKQAEKDGPFPSEGSSEEQSQWVFKQLDRKEFLLVIPAFEKLKVSKKKFLLWEDFDKSQRWLLVRSHQKWELLERKWTFH